MTIERSAGIILFKVDGGRRLYLFLKRGEGFLDFPKGHIEDGESLLEAAVRETKEEAGISARPIPAFSVDETYWFNKGRNRVRKEVRMFLAQVGRSTKVRISHEHSGYVWLNINEALRRVKFDTQKNIMKEADSYAGKYIKMKKLNNEYAKLPDKIGSWSLSRAFVGGEGPLSAEIMLVGQAPGANEDRLGRPFIGRSGRLLTQLLKSAGVDRDKVYICSCVQFFPPKNRMPYPAEIKACKPFLMEQIQIVNPKIIVLVGALASREVVGVKEIMKAHGSIIEGEMGRRYFVTLHPAAAVRLKKNMKPIKEDFLKLKGILSEFDRNRQENSTLPSSVQA